MTDMRIGLLTILVGVAMQMPSLATEIVPNTQYQGEIKLSSKVQGVSFVLPQGWAGGLPGNSDFFVMQSQSYEGYIFGGIRDMTIQDAEQIMSKDVPLGNGITFHPLGKVRLKDSVLTADYRVSGAQSELIGRINTTIGQHGWSVYFIAAAKAQDKADLFANLNKLSSSLVLTEPGAGGTNEAPSAKIDYWQPQLAGRKLSRFYTSSGYTEEQYLWLCPDGGFYRSFNSGGFGAGASGAFESKYQGRWRTSGSAAQGRLELVYHDNSITSYQLSSDGSKLFLDGKRWFRETYRCQ